MKYKNIYNKLNIFRRDYRIMIFLALMIAVFLPVFILNIYNNNRYQKLLLEKINDENTQTIEKYKNIVNINLDNVIADITTISQLQSIRLMSYKEDVGVLIATDREDELIRNIFITDLEGDILYSSSGIIRNIKDEEYFRYCVEYTEPFYSDVKISEINKKPIQLIYTAPIMLNDKVQGVIGAEIDIVKMNELLGYDNEASELFIMSDSGLVLNTNYQNIDASIAKEIILKGNGIISTNEYLIEYGELKFDNLYIVTRTSHENIEDMVNENYYVHVMMNLFILIFVGIVSYFLSFYFASPLNQLTKPVKKIAAGNMDVKVSSSLLKRRDQFGDLARTFDKMIDNIRQLTYFDALTGIPNRHFFLNRIEEEIFRVRHSREMIGIVYIDFDRFKSINDAWGSDVGDQVLKRVVKIFEEKLDDKFFFARIDGDELGIIITGYTDEDDIIEAVKNIFAITNGELVLDILSVSITSSVGVAIQSGRNTDIDELLKGASIAIYKAKRNGGKQYQIYNEKLDDEIVWLNKLRNDLAYAIDKNELELYYQPLYDVNKDRVYGAEALLRWKHSKYGMISPNIFIPLAEESKEIINIGRWVVQEACKQNIEWQAVGIHDLVMSVNISSKHFIQEGFGDEIKDVIHSLGYRPELLEIEITESVAIENEAITRAVQEDLKALGVLIALDDFGTGYSSLSYITKFVFDTIKIDREFIMNLGKDEKHEMIISSIISIGKILGLTIIAEGVEKECHIEFLRDNGCSILQGYYYSKPIPPQVFYDEFLNNKPVE